MMELNKKPISRHLWDWKQSQPQSYPPSNLKQFFAKAKKVKGGDCCPDAAPLCLKIGSYLHSRQTPITPSRLFLLSYPHNISQFPFSPQNLPVYKLNGKIDFCFSSSFPLHQFLLYIPSNEPVFHHMDIPGLLHFLLLVHYVPELFRLYHILFPEALLFFSLLFCFPMPNFYNTRLL